MISQLLRALGAVLAVLLLAALLLVGGQSKATTTTTLAALPSLTPTTAYTDLGPGPMLLSGNAGIAVYEIADTQPALSTTGHTLKPGETIPIPFSTHVWAKASTTIPASVVVSSGSSSLIGVQGANNPYTLATNVSAAGATTPVTGIVGASYILACVASNWNGATAQLQALGPDGVTYLNVGSALSANGPQGVVLGALASARLNVVGAPTGLNCNLS